MKVFEETIEWGEKKYFCEYYNEKDFSNLAPITQVQAICMIRDGRFVIYEDKNGKFGLPGGSVEPGENLEETLVRELYEEASIRPIKSAPLMYLKITNLTDVDNSVTFQVRYGCIVELLDAPVSDPAGKAISRHVVDRESMLNMLDWGEKLIHYINEFNNIKDRLI